MDERNDMLGMLDLMLRPGFCVKDNRIIRVNQAAKGFFLSPGTELEPMLLTGVEEYSEFTGGCLYLTLSVGGHAMGASVTRMQDMDIFLLEQDADNRELQFMALVARELREPLANVMINAENLIPQAALQDDPHAREGTAKLNKGLFQMLRVIGNMSDACRYSTASRQELLTVSDVIYEIMEKAQAMIAHTGIRLRYSGPQESVLSMADKEQLERSVLNMLSNALKFTPKDGTIEVSLTRKGRMLRLSVTDSGCGIDESVRANVFNRYLRQLSVEDSRFGIGLGMVLIRCTAANHGGAVLIDHPEGKGTRITMTMMIRENPDSILRSPLVRVDYAGGHDHTLLELSDCLPASLYEAEL